VGAQFVHDQIGHRVVDWLAGVEEADLDRAED